MQYYQYYLINNNQYFRTIFKKKYDALITSQKAKPKKINNNKHQNKWF